MKSVDLYTQGETQCKSLARSHCMENQTTNLHCHVCKTTTPNLEFPKLIKNYYFSSVMSGNDFNKTYLSNALSLVNNASCYWKIECCNCPLFKITNNSKHFLKIKMTSIAPFVILNSSPYLYLQNDDKKNI